MILDYACSKIKHVLIIRGGSRNFEKGGASLKKMFTTKNVNSFFKPCQCDYGLIDDSMTYIVAGDSRNGWNHLALQLQKSTTRDRLHVQ